jgi:glycosyltransferase involved in cell wall biosynthesis
LKILFFIDKLKSGGKERRMTELLIALKSKSDIECELLIMHHDVHFKEVFELGIKVSYIIRKVKKDLSIFNQLYKICRASKPDIIHCWDSMTALYSVPVCKLLGIKLVNGMITDAPPLNRFYKPRLRARLTFPFSDIIVGNSKAGLTAYSAPKYKSYVVYNGFNMNRIDNLIKREVIIEKLLIQTRYIVGMVANFTVFKDYKTYYKAAHKLLETRNDVTFLAIGLDTDSEFSERLIDHKNKTCFRLLGKLSDVESLINVMDVCVLSTYSEGISNSIMEYMALGKPVIVSSGGGSDELIINDLTGYLIPPSDPDPLCEKLDFLLNHSEIRKNMGAAGKKRIEIDFPLNSMVEKYITLYKLCIS